MARSFDIATGFFEIGALLALDGRWQRLDRIRILTGDELSLRTRQAFSEALRAGSASWMTAWNPRRAPTRPAGTPRTALPPRARFVVFGVMLP
ncbi:MAG: hypothetical protein OXP08_11650 [bacterium]|nr:hypothetical protein [bacterium]